MTREDAIAIAERFVNGRNLPVGKLADARHTPAGEFARWGLDVGHGLWLVCFHYVGPLAPAHPKVTLRTDVGWLLCVEVNDVTGAADLWQDYRDASGPDSSN